VTTGAMSGKRSLILSYRESISVLVKVERDGSWTVVASGMVGPVAAVAYNNALDQKRFNGTSTLSPSRGLKPASRRSAYDELFQEETESTCWLCTWGGSVVKTFK